MSFSLQERFGIAIWNIYNILYVTYIILNLYIQVCCAIYDYVHNRDIRVVGNINSYLEKNIQREKVKKKLEAIAQVGNIKACCAMYYYVHKNGIRVVGMINSFFEKAIRSDNVEMKLER